MSELIDNRAHRIRTLKTIIKRLHGGESPEAVKTQMKELVGETDYSEIVAMEQELMADGMPVEEMRGMCDLHSLVTREVLVQIAPPGVEPGHPLDTFRRENDAIRGVLERMRAAMSALEAVDDAAPGGKPLMEWRQAYNDLMDVEKHYQRKENALFSKLEAHGITGPSKVMWAKHDDVRALLKEMGAALSVQDATAGEFKLVAATAGETAAAAVEEMIHKEENILLPMSQNTLTEDEWADIWLASPRYGWCLVEPLDGYRPPEQVVKQGLKLSGGEDVELPTGTLALKQMIALFNTLPVDITFVDASDRVAFFSEGPDRVFARSRAIIGRKVQHCHPPKSVDTVERIVGDFRAGRQDVAEFWIQLHGKFVHIRYFALRSEEGEYLGTLEVTQDLTRLRALEGERRLLEYDTPAKGENA
ncbi:MAG: DUF438 domain-containing protein [Bryobacteraceae bacterium]|nr:DUF438 domain-containing protein [Bryobacteraceae bacterium]